PDRLREIRGSMNKIRPVPITAPRSVLSGFVAIARFAARVLARRPHRLLLAALAAAWFAAATPTPAAADFTICNYSGSRVGVALGYKVTEGWVTEGWWNLFDRTCEALLRGGLVARYYYV